MEPLHTLLPRIQDKLTNWWEFGEQKDPCLLIQLAEPHAPPPPPGTEDLRKHWFDIDYVISHAMYGIEHTRYLGVSAPMHFPNLGSAAMAGVLGARMEYVDKRTIWPYPADLSLEQVLEIELDPRNEYYATMLEITRRSVALSHDHHWVAPYPLEGPGDCLEGVYGTLNLLMAMVEQTKLVKAAIEHFTTLWIYAFDEVEQIIESAGNPGAIGWADIWAPGRTFPLQEDFSYNISPAMFREFLLPSLQRIVEAMPYPMFHLDGTTNHLETLLSIPGLRAIQWVPGPGREELAPWYGLIRRIKEASKSVEVFARPDEIDDLVANVGARGLLIGCSGLSEKEAERLLDRYGD
jgi:hypothetical protein